MVQRPDSRRRGTAAAIGDLIHTGREVVGGAAGARPGRQRRSAAPAFEAMGRWVEDKFNWLLEDEDDWPETWDSRMASGDGHGDPLPPPRSRGRNGNQPARHSITAGKAQRSPQHDRWGEDGSGPRRAAPLSSPGAPADSHGSEGEGPAATPQTRRRPLDVVPRPAPARPSNGERPLAGRAGSLDTAQARQPSPAEQDWPPDDLFMVERWERPRSRPAAATPLRQQRLEVVSERPQPRRSRTLPRSRRRS